jgi:hypothetical protein
VHSRREELGAARACQPIERGLCLHGRPLVCTAVHEKDDAELGEPLCPDCFDYTSAVLWNAMVPELWRRTTISIWRHLASLAGISRSALARRARLSFVKVIEYQRRGVVHVHAVVRLDGPEGPCSRAPEELGMEQLLLAIRMAVSRTQAPIVGGHGLAQWGRQLDVRPLPEDEGLKRAVGAYLAKYATKSTDDGGRLDHPLHHEDLDLLGLRPHLRRMVLTAWKLGGWSELAPLRLRAWAHTLGFPGPWVTKSRRYSTTFGSLRSARQEWRAATDDHPCDELDDEEIVTVRDWRFAGRGWTTAGDEWLAETAARNHADMTRIAREELSAERHEPAEAES